MCSVYCVLCTVSCVGGVSRPQCRTRWVRPFYSSHWEKGTNLFHPSHTLFAELWADRGSARRTRPHAPSCRPRSPGSVPDTGHERRAVWSSLRGRNGRRMYFYAVSLALSEGNVRNFGRVQSYKANLCTRGRRSQGMGRAGHLLDTRKNEINFPRLSFIHCTIAVNKRRKNPTGHAENSELPVERCWRKIDIFFLWCNADWLLQCKKIKVKKNQDNRHVPDILCIFLWYLLTKSPLTFAAPSTGEKCWTQSTYSQ